MRTRGSTSTKVSVVIVTRNRKHIIEHCLSSLSTQTAIPRELIVIDNDSTDGTRELVKSWGKTCPFPVRVVTEKKIGYPYVYNRGLKEAKSDWVAFIDDDCIAEPNWIEEAQKGIKRYSDVVAILGFSGTQKEQNIFSLATFLFNFDWKEKWTAGHRVRNYEVLDNKNILYYRPFLLQHGIRFAEERIGAVGGAAEDCELGWQIQRAGGKAVYHRTMVVKHKDPDHWQWYWKKYFTSLAAFVTFSAEREELLEKSANSALRASVVSPNKVPFRKYALTFADQHKKNPLWKVQFITLVYATVAMSYFLKYMFIIPRLREWYIHQF